MEKKYGWCPFPALWHRTAVQFRSLNSSQNAALNLDANTVWNRILTTRSYLVFQSNMFFHSEDIEKKPVFLLKSYFTKVLKKNFPYSNILGKKTSIWDTNPRSKTTKIGDVVVIKKQVQGENLVPSRPPYLWNSRCQHIDKPPTRKVLRLRLLTSEYVIDPNKVWQCTIWYCI